MLYKFLLLCQGKVISSNRKRGSVAELIFLLKFERLRKRFSLSMSDPKYSYPYPAQGYPQPGQQGYYQPQPPVMAPPQYTQAPPRKEPGFLEGCLAALCCCCLLDECCCDPTVIFS
ncbi:protein CYSTEINE-RICH TRANSMEMBRANE MODULE 11 [Cryptomeria japonica]|uniref:protein CYSTEINE-RICH TRANSMEMBRANE MODULE 11 n=1 Tax=Cryptomeria japonica TaxID=3369 RepID=UPI0027DA4E78|nr:protein CYSTEINE-RICH TRANSMEMBRANE MODULE 11 [Cryptomeria japonica]